MGRRLVGIVALLLILVPGALFAEEAVSESTYRMEEYGTPYPPEEFAAPPSGEAMIMDLLIVRPVSILALAVGTGASILATPVALASGTTGTVYHRLVVEPYNFLVCRPLGAF